MLGHETGMLTPLLGQKKPAQMKATPGNRLTNTHTQTNTHTHKLKEGYIRICWASVIDRNHPLTWKKREAVVVPVWTSRRVQFNTIAVLHSDSESHTGSFEYGGSVPCGQLTGVATIAAVLGQYCPGPQPLHGSNGD